MANERKPSNRKQPDDEPTDEWDDLLDDPFDDADDDTRLDDEPVEPKKKAAPEHEPEPAPRRRVREEAKPPTEAEPRQRKRPAPKAEEEGGADTFDPEQLEGAEKTKDGLIRVKEGAVPKKDGKEKKGHTPWLKSLGIVDYIGLAASVAILVGLASMLLTWMYGQDWGEGLDRPQPVPDVPAAGTLFKVTSVDSYWRRRVDTDRAPSSELILPEITIEVEAVGSEGFLSVLFLEPSGTMSADPGNLRLSGGQLSIANNEGRQDGPNRFTFTSTKGFEFETEFRSYISLEDLKPWTIEIVEASEYGADNSKRIAFFEIAKDARTKQEDSSAAATPPAE